VNKIILHVIILNHWDNILNEVINKYNVKKDIAKQLFIQLLFFGSFNSWIQNNNIIDTEPLKFIEDFQNEIKLIGEIIISKNDKLKKTIEKQKEEKNIKNYNIKGSVCSYFFLNIIFKLYIKIDYK